MTIQLPPSSDPYPIFEVRNLALDLRFSNLSFVQGGPQLRFYAGTPLTTKRGINIGSLCVMDVEPREGLSPHEARTLGWLAGLAIAHLETTREAMEGKRAKLMSHAWDVFVDGKSMMGNSSRDASRAESVQRDQSSGAETSSNRPTRIPAFDGKSGGVINSHASSAVPPSRTSADFEEGSEDRHASTKDRTTTSSDPSSEDEEGFGGRGQREAGSESHGFTFSRAANVLRECFEIEDGDGVFFLGAGTGLAHSTGSGVAMGAHQETQDGTGTKNDHGDTPSSPTYGVGTNTSFDPLISAFAKQTKKPAPVLASSTRDEPFLRGQHPRGRAALGEVDQDILGELCKRYPQGKIWSLENGAVASSSEDDQAEKLASSTSSHRRNRSYHRRGEASIMTKLFPGVRQILFVPLWDAAVSRWASGGFIWSISETRVFSKTDLGFLNVFGKTIMAECSRLDTRLADKQKADFIGSISHELRSPLHGILAGAEFLGETASTAFQKSLIETIEACGRTLLDTINHVLDFSKINSLDRNWRNNRQPRKRLGEGKIGHGAQMSAKQLPSGAPPLLRLYAVTDIATVTEEVVEVLSVGQIYSQATDLTDISGGNRGLGADKGMRIAPRTHGGREDVKQADRDPIEVLLDIAREDWVFMAQPGAIRRIIMNLFGK
jgi:signal transduction histidine kinase